MDASRFGTKRCTLVTLPAINWRRSVTNATSNGITIPFEVSSAAPVKKMIRSTFHSISSINMFAFGPLVFDSCQLLLYEGDKIIELPVKAAEVLRVLLENAGEVVPKDTIRQQVWGHTFTGDENLSKNISLLRTVLRTHIGDVEVIRTLPKRGYQFSVPVQRQMTTQTQNHSSLTRPSAQEEKIWQSQVRALSSATWRRDNVHITAEARGPKARQALLKIASARWLSYGAAIILAVTGIGLAVSKSLNRSHRPAAMQPRLAILTLENLSDQADEDWFGIAIKGILARDLAKDGGVRLPSDIDMMEAEDDLEVGKMRAIDDSTVQKIGHRLNCDTILTGSYLAKGDTLRFDLQLRSAATGHILKEVNQTSTLDSAMKNVMDAASFLRQFLGLPSVANGASNVSFGPPGSPYRISSYTSGIRLIHQGKPIEAQPYLYEAELLNPSSALVHSALASDWSMLGYNTRANLEAGLAMRTASSVPNDERLAIEANAYAIQGDVSRAETAYTTLRKLHPLEPDFARGLAEVHIRLNAAPEALKDLNAFVASSEEAGSNPWISLAEARTCFALSEWREELLYAGQAIRQAHAVGSSYLEIRALHWEEIAWMELGNTQEAKGDIQRMKSLSLASGDAQGLRMVLMYEANELGYENPESLSTEERLLALDVRLGDFLNATSISNNMGVIFAQHENWISARSSFQQSADFAVRAKYPAWAVYGLSNAAMATASMDHLDEAFKELSHTLSLAQALKYDDGLTEVETSLGVVELAKGDLKAAQKQFDLALEGAAKRGNMAQVAREKRALATVEVASGDLNKARQFVNDAMALNVLSGGDLSDLQLTDATLKLEEGNAEAVTEPMTRLAMTSHSISASVEAWRLVAESWLLRGNLTQALPAIANALKLASNSPDTHDCLIPVSITEARIYAARGDTIRALDELSEVLIHANKIGDVPLNLEIRLRQGEIQRSKERATRNFGRSAQTLESVLSDAKQRGFNLIARKARTALDSR